MGVTDSREQRREAAVAKLKKQVQAQGYEQWHPDSFFNRKAELTKLLDFLRGDPTCVMLMVGPKDCGKTALLREAKRVWETESTLLLRSPMFYIDCRLTNFGNVTDAPVAIAEAFRTFTDRLQILADGIQASTPLGGSVNLGNVIASVRADIDANQGSDMHRIMSTMLRYMSRYPDTRPVFIIDEANCLKSWLADASQQFFSFFTALTKQDQRAYLILSSSDDFFISWALGVLQDGQWTPFGVGPFTAVDARAFYDSLSAWRWQQHLDDDWNEILDRAQMQDAKDRKLKDEDWEKVYKVCGGSPQLLKLCATQAATCPLDDVLEGLVEDAKEVVSRGLDGMGKWNGNKYKSIMQSVVKEGSIGYDEIVRRVYGNDEKTAKVEVLAMLSANVLHVRYARRGMVYADLTIPHKKHHRYQIMARSPTHLAALRDELS